MKYIKHPAWHSNPYVNFECYIYISNYYIINIDTYHCMIHLLKLHPEILKENISDKS